MIGAIHLTIAHVWNAIALAPAVKALAQIGWIGLVWSMNLTAQNMVLGKPYPGFFLPLFVTSVTMILLFMTSPKDLKKDFIQHAMFPLTIVNCFVDVVSYIRLFAVGMASLAVAQSFNSMAIGMGVEKIWTVPIIALILLLGHGLNIILCALGVLVHGVRLNTLEFSGHKNIEWKGVPYRPFAGLVRDLPK
jgi:V/A-type H+-transporting ATPase subunit I